MQKKVKDLFTRSGNIKENIDVEPFTKEPQMAQLLNMLIYNYPGTYQRAITTAEIMAYFLEREHSLRDSQKTISIFCTPKTRAQSLYFGSVFWTPNPIFQKLKPNPESSNILGSIF